MQLINIEAEKSVLGSILLDNSKLDEIELFSNDFGIEGHALIFHAMLRLQSSGTPIDLVTLTDRLENDGELHIVGGAGYLSQLFDFVPSPAVAKYYAKAVRNSAVRRRAIDISKQIDLAARGKDFDDNMGEIENLIFSIRDGGETEPQKIDIFTQRAVNRLGNRETAGIKTGYKGVDKLTGGFKPEQFIIVAGRPGMGKSVVIMNIADYMASHGYPTCIFSLEMSEEQFSLRRIAFKAKVDSSKFNNPNTLTKEEINSITSEMKRDTDNHLFIDGSTKLTISSLRRKSLTMVRKHGVKAFFIDYVQLMTPEDGDTREQKVASISRGIKLLAKETKTPFILACQLNRNLEIGGKPRKPNLSDIRESGALEQDADIVIFPWREAAYCHQCKELRRDCGQDHFTKAEMIIDKHRNGPTGSIKMVWIPEYQAFGDLFL